MKLTMLSVAFVLVFCVRSAWSADTGQTERTPEEEAVHKAVNAIVAAIDGNDADAFDRLSTPDYTFVNPVGRVWTKKQYLELIRSRTLKVESYSRDEESIRFYGNTAVVIYRSTPHGTLDGQQLITNQRRVTTIMIKEDGRWYTAGRQSTPIAESAPHPAAQ